MSKRHYYRDANGLHWISEDDLDGTIFTNASENVCDLGNGPDQVGWEEYREYLNEMVGIIIESRVADGVEIRSTW